MAEGFDVTIPEARPLKVRRTAWRTRTHYLCPEDGGADVLTVTGSLSVLDRMLRAYNRTFRAPANSSAWIVCRPRRGGGWTPLPSTTSRTRRGAIAAYEVDGSEYRADRRRLGVQVMRCALAPVPPTDAPVRG